MAKQRQIGMIVAMSPDRVIGRDGKIPWHYSGDLKRFKALTMGSTLVMGRNTFESIGKPLPGRRNLVVTRRSLSGVECLPSIRAALDAAQEGPIWFIGGAGIYQEAMDLVDLIDVTHVPDAIPVEGSICFPEIDPTQFEAGAIEPHPTVSELRLQQFFRSVRREPVSAEIS
jgi:dihydrofolate reductase